jgi:hypothetical protein
MAPRKRANYDLFGNPIGEPSRDPAGSAGPAAHISPKMEEYREFFESFTVEKLQRIRLCLGFEFKKGNKAALVSAALGFFSLLEETVRFQEWFESLPSYLSRALEEASFSGHIEADLVEEMAGEPVLVETRYSYYERYQINPDLRLGIFDLYGNYDRKLLFLTPIFRKLMATMLPKPSHYTINRCAEQDAGGWSAAETISESMPLLLRSIGQLLQDKSNHEKILRRGINKREIRELRMSSAFPSFPLGAKTGTDPIDLITRFLMIDPEQLIGFGAASGTVSENTKDVRDFIKDLVTTFFVLPPSGKIISHYLLVDSSFEYSVLCPHVSKGRGPRLHRSFFNHYPPARSIFHQMLNIMAGFGGWFDVEEAIESLRMQALPFTIFRNEESAANLIVKGETLLLPEATIETDGWEKGFIPDIYLTHPLITGPLLKGYCYLMASLGLLEIREVEPEKRLVKNGKFSPVSPFEALSRVRVTPFGAWCLGTSQEKPELREAHYEAIADRELLLVTYRGQSLECKVFLERIGDPIGENRFRISEASFIRECRNEEEIEHRIGEFYRLIARDPAGHWEEFFARVRERAALFDHEEPCVMIRLPEDRELRRLFLEEKKLSSLVVRAEGGRIVVSQGNYKKLRKVLEEYGVLKG